VSTRCHYLFLLTAICNIFHVLICTSSILLRFSILSYYLLLRFMSSISTDRVGIRWAVDKSIACVKTQISLTSTSSLYLVTGGNRQVIITSNTISLFSYEKYKTLPLQATKKLITNVRFRKQIPSSQWKKKKMCILNDKPVKETKPSKYV